jgi:methionyl-tRNA synthetase
VAKFYITTAIDYSNGDPHIGHAFEKIGADALARYRRMCGDDVHFLIGMDEHGQKVAQAAAAGGVRPQEFVDSVAAKFEATWGRLGISHDQFIRTTAPAHKAGVRALIKRCHDNNPDDFYEREYEGWYCVGCEQFKRENEIVAGNCVLHPTRELEWASETNWFFRLSKYEGFLRELLEKREHFLQPASRRNEMLGLIAQGLEDISITRARLEWAIPFPLLSAGGEQGTWVWFDALPNYLTATGYPDRGYRDRWPAQLHVVGKDITRLHAIVWPAMLQCAELPLPERIWAHGFVLTGGERFSKSAGVRLDLDAAIAAFGADAFRYFLLREVPFDADGTFSWERFEERYKADLANALGNLASRTIAMIEKYFAGVVPAGERTDADAFDAKCFSEYHASMDGTRGYLLHEALAQVWQSIARANEFVQQQAPWALAKDPARRSDLERVLASVARQLVRHAVSLAPFMPDKASELWSQLGGSGRVQDASLLRLDTLSPAGWRVARGGALFPREDSARE